MTFETQLICPECGSTTFEAEIIRSVQTYKRFKTRYELNIIADTEAELWGIEADFEEEQELPNGDVIEVEFADTVDKIRNKIIVEDPFTHSNQITILDDDGTETLYVDVEEEWEGDDDEDEELTHLACTSCGHELNAGRFSAVTTWDYLSY